MAAFEMSPIVDHKTLAHRIAEGRLPVSEALRYAMQVGESLRRLHDAGEVHGSLSPLHILLTENGAELMAAEQEAEGVITPYTAPEVLLGRPADPRTDIFSFGAVLYEMLTGRKAFEGEGRATLSANIAGAPTPSSGSPAADRLIGPCLAKNPDARMPRMQKILMELKLLSVAARRAEAAAASPAKKETEASLMRAEVQAFESRIVARLAAHEQRVAEMQRASGDIFNAGTQALREEVGQVEAQIAARLASHEEAVVEIQRSAMEAVGTLKEQLVTMNGDLVAVQEALNARPSEAELSQRILSRVDLGFEAAGEHIGRMEKTLEELRNHTSHFERSVAADLVDIEQNLKAHTASIEAARTAMSQTDDLVERVVEALESLQTAVLDQSEPNDQAAFAVN
jgi:eukaryotic-like serine/threonine-protein kinase